MKKYLALLLIIIFTLTGCTKYEESMKINDDKSMDISFIVAAKDEALKHKENIDKKYNNLINILESDEKTLSKIFKDYKIEKYSKDDYNGFTFTRHINNIKEVSTNKTVTYSILDELSGESNLYIFNIKDSTYKSVYTANIIVDLSEDKQYSVYNDYMDYKFILNTPFRVQTNNADKVKDNIYTWNIKYGQFNDINFSFVVENKTNSILGIIVKIILVLIVIFVLFKIRYGSKENESLKYKVNLENIDTSKTLNDMANDTLKEEDEKDN